MQYILVDDKPVQVGDVLEWSEWMGKAERVIARDEIKTLAGVTFLVSTVFLGVDHNFNHNGPPIVFETMVFADHSAGKDLGDDIFQQRYSTKEQAVAGHNKVVEIIYDAATKAEDSSD